MRVVTRRAPTPGETNDLLFAWRVAKFVKSNAIVYCRDGRTLGIGAGQMSRVDSTRIAAFKAANAGLSLTGAVVASDAFFPFRDGLDVVADNGAAAVIQPGGSVRDAEVIAAADERGHRHGVHRCPALSPLRQRWAHSEHPRGRRRWKGARARVGRLRRARASRVFRRAGEWRHGAQSRQWSTSR